MKRKPRKLSDQFREAILTAPMSRAQIARLTGVSEPLLSRFVNCKTNLSLNMLDKIGELLDLRIVAGGPPKVEAPRRGRAKKGR